MNKISAALTRKFGPLPAWAWLTIIGGGAYYWRHRAGAAASSTGSAAGVSSGAGTGTAGGVDAGLGGGGGGTGDSGLQPFSDQLPPAYQQQGGPVTFDPTQSTGADTTPTDSGASSPTDTTPSTNPTAPQKPAGATGALLWGGTQFRTRARFVTWLNQHGATLAGFKKNHPAAYATFLRLPAGVGVKPKHAQEKRAPTLVSEHGKGAGFTARRGARPVSVRTVPVRSHVEQARPVPAARVVHEHGEPAPHARTAPSTHAHAAAAGTRIVGGVPKPSPAAMAHEHHEPAPAPKPAARPAPLSREPGRIATAPARMDTRPAPPPPAPHPAPVHAPSKPAKQAPPHPVSRIPVKARPR